MLIPTSAFKKETVDISTIRWGNCHCVSWKNLQMKKQKGHLFNYLKKKQSEEK